jgi:hypothetical protein
LAGVNLAPVAAAVSFQDDSRRCGEPGVEQSRLQEALSIGLL